MRPCLLQRRPCVLFLSSFAALPDKRPLAASWVTGVIAYPRCETGADGLP
jgi:hypothetical protein